MPFKWNQWEGENIAYVLNMMTNSDHLDMAKIVQDTGMSKSMIRAKASKLAKEHGWTLKHLTTSVKPLVIKEKYVQSKDSVKKHSPPIEAQVRIVPATHQKFMCKVNTETDTMYLSVIAENKDKAVKEIMKTYKGIKEIVGTYTMVEFDLLKERQRVYQNSEIRSNSAVTHFGRNRR